MQLPQELLALIHNGESIDVEFKKSATYVTKDVYDTVCSAAAADESTTGISQDRRLYRMFNLDGYDDRDVITTNLLDSCDRLLKFGGQHLKDNFALDGIVSVSASDKILREIISNLLAHRDFPNAYVAKMVAERDRIYTENASLSHDFGNLELASTNHFRKAYRSFFKR